MNGLSAFFPGEDWESDNTEYEYTPGLDEINRVMNMEGWDQAFAQIDLDSSQVCASRPLLSPSNLSFIVHKYMFISPQDDEDEENGA